ncbi:hypothetical protein BDV18DRAFT_73220 [Aspergillus unguis]
MDWDRTRRFDDHRGGESYRPGSSRGFIRRSRSPPRIRSPSTRLVADTWAPSIDRTYNRPRSRSPAFRRRSRSPQPFNRGPGFGPYSRAYPPRRFSPRRDVRPRSPSSTPRRPRSPYREDRVREPGWAQASASRQSRNSSSGRDYEYRPKERRQPSVGRHARSRSPPSHGTLFDDDQRLPTACRTRSPIYPGRRGRETATDRYSGQKRRSRSPGSKHPSASASTSNSRRSSPFDERNNAAPKGNMTRSPQANFSFGRRSSRERATYDRTASTRSFLETLEARSRSPPAAKAPTKPSPNQADVESLRLSQLQDRSSQSKPIHPSNAPSQPKAFSANRHQQSPPPSLPHGSKTLPSHPRASNISILSAPTRPRGNPTFKDNGWGNNSMRRGPAPVTSHGTPIAPRNSQLSATGAEIQRKNSMPATPSPHTPRYSKYLLGLNTILPGGRPASFEFETVTEKRLSQLHTDRERILEQIAENQKLKRAGLRDWDRLDRESSICALKSELAEGHLQCISDAEGTLGRALF